MVSPKAIKLSFDMTQAHNHILPLKSEWHAVELVTRIRELYEDEKLSPSFKNATVLWSLEKIDPRLSLEVKRIMATK